MSRKPHHGGNRTTNEGDVVPWTEAAALAGVSISTLERWRQRGLLRVFKKGVRTFVRRQDVLKLVELRPAGIPRGQGR